MAEERPQQNSHLKFQHTKDSSLISYLMMLSTELKEKAKQAEDPNEKFWYYDASSLIYEILFRYHDFVAAQEARASGR